MSSTSCSVEASLPNDGSRFAFSEEVGVVELNKFRPLCTVGCLVQVPSATSTENVAESTFARENRVVFGETVVDSAWPHATLGDSKTPPPPSSFLLEATVECAARVHISAPFDTVVASASTRSLPSVPRGLMDANPATLGARMVTESTISASSSST